MVRQNVLTSEDAAGRGNAVAPSGRTTTPGRGAIPHPEEPPLKKYIQAIPLRLAPGSAPKAAAGGGQYRLLIQPHGAQGGQVMHVLQGDIATLPPGGGRVVASGGGTHVLTPAFSQTQPAALQSGGNAAQ